MLKKDPALDAFLKEALREDIGAKDLSSSFIPQSMEAKGDALFKEEAVLCGIEIAERIFRLFDPDMRFLPAAKDGEKISQGRVIFYVEGKCRSILASERTALNFLSRMSGISTLTRMFADRVKGTSATIYDTRKTMPLLRKFDRLAVKTGGGENHRFGLSDGVLIKDNHLIALRNEKIKDILKRVREDVSKKILVGIEVKNLDQAKEAMAHWFDYVLLDNFTVDQVRQAVHLRKKMSTNINLEVSGNINLDNVRDYAECGVERISIGALTHSVKGIDLSLNLL